MCKKLLPSLLVFTIVGYCGTQTQAYSGIYLYAFRKAPAQWLLEQNLRAVSIREASRIFPEETRNQFFQKAAAQGIPIVLRDKLLAKIMTNFDDMNENRRKILELSRKVP